MTLNPPPKVRALMYVFVTLGSPVMGYLLVKGFVGEAEMSLWTGVSTVVAGMAALNVSKK